MRDECIEELEDEITYLEGQVTDLGIELCNLQKEYPKISTLSDKIKLDLFKEHFNKFTLEQFERFIDNIKK